MATPHVTLRPVTEADLPILFEHQREPAGNAMASFPAREHEAFLTHWRTKIFANPDAKALAIVLNDEVVGNIGSWTQGDERLVGYWIGSAHWGRGIASAALRVFVTEHERTRPLVALVTLQNLGSQRVLAKCGFERIGEEAGEDGIVELVMALRSSSA